MKHLLLSLTIIILLALSGGIVLASDISQSAFYGQITATNNSTSLVSNVSANFTANTADWITSGFLNASATNVAIRTDTGTDTAFMPGYGSNPWIVFYDSVGANSNRSTTLYTGVTGGKIAYFPSATGMNCQDPAGLESGTSNFTISLRAYINTAAGAFYIIDHYNASMGLRLNTDATAGNITARLYNNPWDTVISKSGVSSGEHTINLSYNGTIFSLQIDSETPVTSAYDKGVGNASANWTIGSTATTYITSANYTIAGTLKGSWDWEYGATFTDDSGNGNTATPGFRTTSSSASVNATLASFSPITEAKSTTDPATDWPSMITTPPEQPTTMYTENSTPGIFFAPLVSDLWPYTGLPTSLFWYSFAFATIILAGLLIFMIFAEKGQSALLIKVITMMAIMVFWSLPGPNLYGMYVPIYFGMWCFGVLVVSRSYGW